MKSIKQFVNATVALLFLCFSFIHGLFLIAYFYFSPDTFLIEAIISSVVVGASILILLFVFAIPENKWPKKTLSYAAIATAMLIDLSGIWLTSKIIWFFIYK